MRFTTAKRDEGREAKNKCLNNGRFMEIYAYQLVGREKKNPTNKRFLQQVDVCRVCIILYCILL